MSLLEGALGPPSKFSEGGSAMLRRTITTAGLVLMFGGIAEASSGYYHNVELVGRFLAEGPTYAVTVQGDYAYVCAGRALVVLDVSDPSSPTKVSQEFLPAIVHSVYVLGSYAYVADRENGLRIIDISDPTHPVELGFCETGGRVYGIYVSERYAYVVGAGIGFRIIDISDPTHPSEIGFCETRSRTCSIYVSGRYAYVADGYEGLRVIDISDPTSPLEVGYYDTGDHASGVYVSGSYAYIADGDDGLRIIDISDPTTPSEVGYYDTWGNAWGVYVSGSYAYVADGYEGLRVIDISDPTSPLEVGYYDTGGHAFGVYVLGSYAYVADSDDGLHILRFIGAEPLEVRGFETVLPEEYALYQNRPNPFNPVTVIGYDLPEGAEVRLEIYNLLGQRVRSLVNGWQGAGCYKVVWDGRDDEGEEVSAGIYLYRLEAGKLSKARKMVLVK